MKKDHQREPELPEQLKSKRTENPFVVPHNYFRELPDEIMRAVQEDQSAIANRPGWAHYFSSWLRTWLTPRPVMAMATLVLLLGGVFWWTANAPDDDLLTMEEFEQHEIMQYIEKHLDEFDEADFYTDDAAAMDHPLQELIEVDELQPYLDDIIEDVDIEALGDIL